MLTNQLLCLHPLSSTPEVGVRVATCSTELLMVICNRIKAVDLCRPTTSAGRDFVTENIIDGTGKQAATAAARRQREEADRQQKER